MNFILHFNRLNNSKNAKDIWTVKTENKVYHCKEVFLNVPVITKYKGVKAKQPRAYLFGNAKKIFVRKDTVIIV
jgi:hypothetical protein